MLDSGTRLKPRERWLLVLAALAGGVLALIGIRFVLWPEAAVRFFGLAADGQGRGLTAVVGFRDLWLGGLAIAFAALGEWRALALWLCLGALVCFADAGLVASSGGKAGHVAFHLVSGVFCLALGAATWRRASRH